MAVGSYLVAEDTNLNGIRYSLDPVRDRSRQSRHSCGRTSRLHVRRPVATPFILVSSAWLAEEGQGFSGLTCLAKAARRADVEAFAFRLHQLTSCMLFDREHGRMIDPRALAVPQIPQKTA